MNFLTQTHLPTSNSDEDTRRREALFAAHAGADPKHLSFRDVQRLCATLGLFEATPHAAVVVRNAFNCCHFLDSVDASFASSCPSLPRDLCPDDDTPVLPLTSFRRFLVYLERVFMLVQIFAIVDTSGNFTLSLAELRAAKKDLKRVKIAIHDAEQTFADMDQDHTGSVDFNEFVDWVLRRQFVACGDACD